MIRSSSLAELTGVYRAVVGGPSRCGNSKPRIGLAIAGVLAFCVATPAQSPAAAAVISSPALAAPEGLRRLDKASPVWIDADGGRVVVDGRVVLRRGVLEMFACPAGTKEHESVLAVEAPAFLVHTALLAVGADAGAPVRHHPEYKPPTGDTIEVALEWSEGGQKRTARAQDWVRHAETGEAMDLPFVFAGSGFWTDPENGKQHYLAEGGELVCVSNFAAATLDVPADSTASNEGLLFEPFTERIPPVGTPVRMVLSVGGAGGGNAESGTGATTSGAGVDAAESVAARVRERWGALSEAPPEALLDLLAEMEGAAPLAENWLRMAIDTVAEGLGPQGLPTDKLAEFLADLGHSPRARRTAWELIRTADAPAADTLLDGLLDDPSIELRYDAVAKLLDRAKAAEGATREALLRQALTAARNIDQVEAAEGALKEAGVEVKLTDVLGMVTEWLVVGPFDNRDEAGGFAKAYPPEEKLDASAKYDGHDGEGPHGPFGWRPHKTEHRLGEVELNTGIGVHKGAIGYAWVRVRSDRGQPIEVRRTSACATKVWLNGGLVSSYEKYHSGSPFDQVVAEASLPAGTSDLLVKVCQNEQTEPWTNTWPLQLRLTGPGGAPLEGVSTERPEEKP